MRKQQLYLDPPQLTAQVVCAVGEVELYLMLFITTSGGD